MRLWIFEWVTGGGWPAERPLSGSLAREGRAMAHALATDWSEVVGFDVELTIDARLPITAGPRFAQQMVPPGSIDEQAFVQHLAQYDAVCVIAPETNGLLEKLVTLARESQCTVWNCAPQAIALGADKLQFYAACHKAGIPTITTRALLPEDPAAADSSLGPPWIVKPRTGAGSYAIGHCGTWSEVQSHLAAYPDVRDWVQQPVVVGGWYSVAWLAPPLAPPMVLPIAQQHVDPQNGTYLGGVVPAELNPAALHSLHHATLQLKGLFGPRDLCGWCGFDLVVTTSGEAFVVEFNPRLTSSYLGYRLLTGERLPNWWIREQGRPPRWNRSSVTFEV